jgi:hypothetical protein
MHWRSFLPLTFRVLRQCPRRYLCVYKRRLSLVMPLQLRTTPRNADISPARCIPLSAAATHSPNATPIRPTVARLICYCLSMHAHIPPADAARDRRSTLRHTRRRSHRATRRPLRRRLVADRHTQARHLAQRCQCSIVVSRKICIP